MKTNTHFLSRSVIFRMRNVSEKSYREYQNTLSRSVTFFFEKHAVYGIIWKNIAELARPQMTIWCMRISHLVPKFTDSHS